eukprot:1195070-Prorocentrum_minimum.AAC.2
MFNIHTIAPTIYTIAPNIHTVAPNIRTCSPSNGSGSTQSTLNTFNIHTIAPTIYATAPNIRTCSPSSGSGSTQSTAQQLLSAGHRCSARRNPAGSRSGFTVTATRRHLRTNWAYASNRVSSKYASG